VKQIYVTAPLSRRETDVLRVIGDGKTTSEIAAKLKISLKTVNEYCAQLKKKAGRSQVQPTLTNRSFVACGRC
jgi:DNA-binding NarL/FixJ family response regulator